MHRRALRKLETDLTQFLRSYSQTEEEMEIAPFLQLTSLCQDYVRLILQDNGSESVESESQCSEICERKFERSIEQNDENFYQQSNILPHIARSPIELYKQKSIGCLDTNTRVGKKIRLGKRISENRNFQLLMENLREIIRYQNKIESLLLERDRQMNSAQKQEKLDYHSYFDGGQAEFDGNDFRIGLNLAKSVHEFIEKCKTTSSDLQSFQAITSKQPDSNLSEKTDKKSLLTEMLKQSQILSDWEQEEIDQNITKNLKENKRPLSQVGVKKHHNSQKRLLREIDFSDYRIESIKENGKHGRKKEKKTSMNNCGQCTQCRIF